MNMTSHCFYQFLTHSFNDFSWLIKVVCNNRDHGDHNTRKQSDFSMALVSNFTVNALSPNFHQLRAVQMAFKILLTNSKRFTKYIIWLDLCGIYSFLKVKIVFVWYAVHNRSAFRPIVFRWLDV